MPALILWIQFSDEHPLTDYQRSRRVWLPHIEQCRQTWQHPCGTIRKERAASDPRKRYQSYFANGHESHLRNTAKAMHFQAKNGVFPSRYSHRYSQNAKNGGFFSVDILKMPKTEKIGRAVLLTHFRLKMTIPFVYTGAQKSGKNWKNAAKRNLSETRMNTGFAHVWSNLEKLEKTPLTLCH